MSSSEAVIPAPAQKQGDISSARVLLFASACGLIVANLYYGQPLIGIIAPAIGLANGAAGLTVTLTQLGYCAGLVLLVPLGDLTENRRLILTTLLALFFALILATLAPNAPVFLFAALAIGLSSVSVQILVPIAAHLAADASRGKVVGNVMAGLLTGIMLARPVSSLIASAWGWRAVYGASAVATVCMAAVLRWQLPTRTPSHSASYPQLLLSLYHLLRDTPELRERAGYQATMFGAFSLYWTAVPLVLSSPLYGFGQKGISLFALAGAAGAISAPIAGRLADRGLTWPATGFALALGILAMILAGLGAHGSLAFLLAGGILLDLAVQANLVLGQRALFSLGAHARSRLNGLYLALFFLGGALGSFVASIAYERGGWMAVCGVGVLFPIFGLAQYAYHAVRAHLSAS